MARFLESKAAEVDSDAPALEQHRPTKAAATLAAGGASSVRQISAKPTVTEMQATLNTCADRLSSCYAE